jgi:S-formylglutathione hydrolase FrmB
LALPQHRLRKSSKYRERLFGVSVTSGERVECLKVGTAEPPMFRNSIGGAATALQRAGVHVVYFESPGTAHEWQTWRRDLHEFAPRLFH